MGHEANVPEMQHSRARLVTPALLLKSESQLRKRLNNDT